MNIDDIDEEFKDFEAQDLKMLFLFGQVEDVILIVIKDDIILFIKYYPSILFSTM